MTAPESRIVRLLSLLAVSTLILSCGREQETLPSFHRWGKIELIFTGPESRGMGEPNPFAIPFDVLFTGPDGGNYLVPGFYDGDGMGGMDGNVWKARFSADINGTWSFHTQSPEPLLNGLNGTIAVIDPPVDAPDLYRLGRLEYVGERYFKFRNGGYWIKAGADEPENLLGGAFGENDWEEKKRQIDQLVSYRVNSVYVMTHNIDGDHQDVWPWAGATAEEAKQNADRFDVARLAQWRALFEHIQERGLVIHLVLEDDSAWTGFNYSRYYREIVARFGDLPALYFNFCEEHNEAHTLDEALGYMALLDTIDPYDHPRTIHNVNIPRAEYVTHHAVHAASIQTDPKSPQMLNQLAVDWFAAPLVRGRRPLVLGFDEARPPDERGSWWAVYLGGGIWESLLPVETGYAEYQREWDELVLAKRFMETLPVADMFPANHIVTAGTAFCLAQPGEVYAFYLPSGGEIEVDLTRGNHYELQWFDPRARVREPWSAVQEIEGGPVKLASPTTDDWALRIRRVAGDAVAAPTAVSAKLESVRNQPVSPILATLGADDPGGLVYEILSPPRFGRLDGDPPRITYTPRPGFTGEDHFEWRVTGEAGPSNVATITIRCSATGENIRPRAFSQSVQVKGEGPVTFSLRYTDRDGPGPFRIQIVEAPGHGTISGLDNDITYTPEPGFRGTDRLVWRVSDGEAHSSEARVRIRVN